jgi:hypothetical protein
MSEPARQGDIEERMRLHPRWEGESSVDWFARLGIVPEDAAEPRDPGEEG